MGPVPLVTLAGSSAQASPRPFHRVGHKGIHALFGLQNDASSASAVAAVRPALGNVLFPEETDAAVSAAATANDDFNLINEHEKPPKKFTEKLFEKSTKKATGKFPAGFLLVLKRELESPPY